MALHQRLEGVFQEVFNNSNIALSDDMTATDIDCWDSLAHINLMIAMERTFHVRLTGSELAKTVGELKEWLAREGCQ